MFADTHKIIASTIQSDIIDVYGLKLDKAAISWGSVAPDILPKYKFQRHYEKESLNFIVNEITKLIYAGRNIDFDRIDPISMKVFSTNLGIISHYLSDFVCLPHAQRWTFTTSMYKHLKYEAKLNKYTPIHDFNKNVIDYNDINIYSEDTVRVRKLVKDYIKSIIEEYSLKDGYGNDLDFALSLNLKLTYFVMDSIASYRSNIYEGLEYEF